MTVVHTFILIMSLYNGQMSHIKFDDYEACQHSGEVLKDRMFIQDYVCEPKSSEDK